jgi:hypothetical protein
MLLLVNVSTAGTTCTTAAAAAAAAAAVIATHLWAVISPVLLVFFGAQATLAAVTSFTSHIPSATVLTLSTLTITATCYRCYLNRAHENGCPCTCGVQVAHREDTSDESSADENEVENEEEIDENEDGNNGNADEVAGELDQEGGLLIPAFGGTNLQ